MNRMKCGFYTYRGIAFCFVAAMFCGQTMAQVVEKRGFDSQKKINAFDNTTFVLLICLTEPCIPCAISLLMMCEKLSVLCLTRRETPSLC